LAASYRLGRTSGASTGASSQRTSPKHLEQVQQLATRLEILDRWSDDLRAEDSGDAAFQMKLAEFSTELEKVKSEFRTPNQS